MENMFNYARFIYFAGPAGPTRAPKGPDAGKDLPPQTNEQKAEAIKGKLSKLKGQFDKNPGKTPKQREQLTALRTKYENLVAKLGKLNNTKYKVKVDSITGLTHIIDMDALAAKTMSKARQRMMASVTTTGANKRTDIAGGSEKPPKRVKNRDIAGDNPPAKPPEAKAKPAETVQSPDQIEEDAAINLVTAEAVIKRLGLGKEKGITIVADNIREALHDTSAAKRDIASFSKGPDKNLPYKQQRIKYLAKQSGNLKDLIQNLEGSDTPEDVSTPYLKSGPKAKKYLFKQSNTEMHVGFTKDRNGALDDPKNFDKKAEKETSINDLMGAPANPIITLTISNPNNAGAPIKAGWDGNSWNKITKTGEYGEEKISNYRARVFNGDTIKINYEG